MILVVVVMVVVMGCGNGRGYSEKWHRVSFCGVDI